MKAAFALLADHKVHNFARKLAWDMHQKYRTSIDVCRLPPHVSLKQPFEISEIAPLENYMAMLAGDIHPFEIRITQLQFIPVTLENMNTGLLWLDVEETDYLRQLHNRVNRELEARFGSTQAEYDGSAYHFHITVAAGGQPIDVYRKIMADQSPLTVDLQFIAQELALFLYDDDATFQGGYLSYKTLPLNNK